MTGWPPPLSGEDQWRDVQIWDDDSPGRAKKVRARVVTLWGKLAAINSAGDAWCDSCLRFIPPAELSRPDNPHPVGLPPSTRPYRSPE